MLIEEDRAALSRSIDVHSQALFIAEIRDLVQRVARIKNRGLGRCVNEERLKPLKSAFAQKFT